MLLWDRDDPWSTLTTQNGLQQNNSQWRRKNKLKLEYQPQVTSEIRNALEKDLFIEYHIQLGV